MPIRSDNPEGRNGPPEPIPFPNDPADLCEAEQAEQGRFDLACLPESAEHVIEAIEDMSRRLDDLARELRCLGHFDDEDDGPRAA